MGKLQAIILGSGCTAVVGIVVAIAVFTDTSSENFARFMPDNTLFYVSVKNVSTLRERVIDNQDLLGADEIQEKLDKKYPELFEAMEGELKSISDKISRARLQDMLETTNGVHLGIWGIEKDDEIEMGFAAFARVDDVMKFQRLMGEFGDKIKRDNFEGTEVLNLQGLIPVKRDYYRDERDPASRRKRDLPENKLYAYTMGKVIVIANDVGLRSVLSADKKGLDNPLSNNAAFKTALADFGDKGDLFAFASLDQFQKISQIENEMKRKRRKTKRTMNSSALSLAAAPTTNCPQMTLHQK